MQILRIMMKNQGSILMIFQEKIEDTIDHSKDQVFVARDDEGNHNISTSLMAL